MKLLLSIFALFAVLEVSVAKQAFGKYDMWMYRKYKEHREPPIRKFNQDEIEMDPVEEKWIEQRLNNFDPQDNRTFMMRYYENRAHLQEGGPIFIFVGGEWYIDEFVLNFGHVPDMMREMNGIMFYTEHRYYGQTRPTEDLSMENLRYLNIDQALADLAHFIVQVKSEIPEIRNSGVILIGGSYSATMVTWFLQKYPHLANGAWSSSAPLEAKVDFEEYFEVVTESMKHFGGEACGNRLESAYQELDKLIEAGNSERLEELFKLCYPLDLSNYLDRWSFATTLGGMFAGLVQYHDEVFPTIPLVCDQLMNSPEENDLEALAWLFWYDEDEDPEYPIDYCFDHRYEDTVYFFNGTSWDSLGAIFQYRQWLYQTCAEYGWYQSSGSENQIFGSHFPADLSVQLCKDLYSDLFTPEKIQSNVDRTNIIYGAKTPNVRNVYSTHGQFDPWRPMGVQEDINESSPTFIIPNASHCSDISSISDWDSPEMVASKQRITQLVRQWLGLSETPSTSETPTTSS